MENIEKIEQLLNEAFNLAKNLDHYADIYEAYDDIGKVDAMLLAAIAAISAVDATNGEKEIEEALNIRTRGWSIDVKEQATEFLKEFGLL